MISEEIHPHHSSSSCRRYILVRLCSRLRSTHWRSAPLISIARYTVVVAITSCYILTEIITMATDTLMSSDDSLSWPVLGRPLPPPLDHPSAHEPDPEWEMVVDTVGNVEVAALLGRPRSATMGGEALGRAAPAEGGAAVVDALPARGLGRRSLRRCASTPDLMVTDGAHEVIVEEELDSYDEEPISDDAELIEPVEESDESFEMLSDKTEDVADEMREEEPVLVEEQGEEATLISTPSLGTASWTLASAGPPAVGVWGKSKGPSFKDMLARNINSGDGDWARDKVRTEARLRDSHRRHHLRVRTKPRIFVDNTQNRKYGLMHAHSTGDLSKILRAVEGGHESGGGRAHHPGRQTRRNRQLSATMEEEAEEDYVIGGGGDGRGADEAFVLGDSDAADYYSRKEHGNKCTSNKKKQRPDEAKRLEIILYKKEAQRKKQEKGNRRGGGAGGEDRKKKSKHNKGFGGKKERRKF